MNNIPFVHLHLHTSNSLLDGALSINKAIQKAKKYEHPAICCTDHGNANSTYQFWKECKDNNLKFIVGCEFYITTDISIRLPNRQREIIDKDKHIIVLCKDDVGYNNMNKLIYYSYVDGYYYKPRITFEKLFEHKEGLIICTACAAGMTNQLFTHGLIEESEEWFKKLKNEFGEDLYAEIQLNEVYGNKDNDGIDQKEINDNIIKLSKKYDVKLILTGDVHYVDKEDVMLQDIMINCQRKKEGATVELGQSFMHARHCYYQSSEDFFEFNNKFEYYYDESFITECLNNTLLVAEKCNFNFKTGVNNYPLFELPEGVDKNKFFRKLVYKGLYDRLQYRINRGDEFTEEQLAEYESRLEFELKVIIDKGYVDYFLIYQDALNNARDNGIMLGVGRGSAAGALISFSLGITGINPLEHGLYFERFLNPTRNSPPDIDCLPFNTLVKVEKGCPKQIGKLKVGDIVKTPFGNTKIIAKNSRKKRDGEKIYEIRTNNGACVWASEDHLIPILKEYIHEKIEIFHKTLRPIHDYDNFKVSELVKLIGKRKLMTIAYHQVYSEVISIQEVECDRVLYDITLEKYNMFYAKKNVQDDFLLVHNCDIMEGGREVIRHYLENKYGKDSVFGVMTQGLYQVKSALQDVSRGMGKDTSFKSTLMNEICKIPELDESIEDLNKFFDNFKSDFRATDTMVQWIEENQEVIYWANKMIGLTKSVGTHAGGVVVTPSPIYNYIPITKGGKELVTAFRESDGSGHDLSDLGLLKMDLLGLKTLNVIKGCIDDIKNDYGKDLTDELNNLNLNDKKVIKKFAKGNNIGIFQMSGNQQDMLVKRIKPDSFDDIVAINAINRPGPLEKFGQSYGEWKQLERERNTKKLKEIEKIRFPFDFMKPILKDTYGCLLLQEQLMLMVCEIAGFTMGEADTLRRSIAWTKDHPKYHTVEKLFNILEQKIIEKGYTKEDADSFLAYCRDFAGYSFCKSHAVAYSYIAFQCLWLKTYYPSYFYANLLTVQNKSEEYQPILADAIANGIKIIMPSVKNLHFKFKAEKDAVIIGLKAIKGFGDIAYDELIKNKVNDIDNIYDILSLPFKKLNKSNFQSLIDVGTFDCFNIEREKIQAVKDLYNDDKIEKWFTRKNKFLQNDTMPDSLLFVPEMAMNNIINKLKPITIKLKEEIIEDEKIYFINKFAERFNLKKEIVQKFISEMSCHVKEKKAIKLLSLEFLDDYVIDDEEKELIIQGIQTDCGNYAEEKKREEPWKQLISEIIPYINVKLLNDKQKDEKIEELLGFSINMVNNLSKILTLQEQYKDLNLKSISAHENEFDLCFWYLISKSTARTKTGKEYWMLKITDGSLNVVARCWDKLDFKKDYAYISNIKKDKYGYSIVVNDNLSEVDFNFNK